MSKVRVSYFSDLLCIWAYIADRRVEELAGKFGDDVEIEAHYCSVFPDAWGKIGTGWATRGGFAGFNAHVNDVAKSFPEINVHDRLWLEVRPRTSASGHLFLKAVELCELKCDGEAAERKPYLERLSTRAAVGLRQAFFVDAKDISDWSVHRELAEAIGLSYSKIEEKIRTSEAITRLAADYDLSQKMGVQGSPTFIMNEGRQKLFGNVGYRLIEANVRELLRHPKDEQASWC